MPVAVTDASDKSLLMLAYASREALLRTVDTGCAWFFSRSRNCLWKKGETSGHSMEIVSIHTDCDSDTVWYEVRRLGPACHTGEVSCFINRVVGPASRHAIDVLRELDQVITERARQLPEGSYVARLLRAGPASVSRKIGEEATEVILAALTEEPERLASEIADLWFHSLMLLACRDKRLDDVLQELSRRRPR